MNKDEILKMSREENQGQSDERELQARSEASRIGMLVGAAVCAALVFASNFILNAPEIGLASWLVYCSMNGGGCLALFHKLGNRHDLLWGLVEILITVALAALLVIRCVNFK